LRKIHQKQQTLTPVWSAHEHAKELEAISEILDSNPTIAAVAAQDLIDPDRDPSRGAPGMTADQVVRCAVIKQMHEYSYEALAFHIDDSHSYQRFCRIGIGDKPWKRSTLAENIKRIGPSTWEAIHRVLVQEAQRRGIESGRKVRMDCTVVDSAIHHPLDSALLYDVVRVLCRLMGRCSAYCDIEYSDRTRRAKRRSLEILNAKKKAQRTKAYRDLLCVTREVLGFVDAALPILTLFAKEFNQDGSIVVCGLLSQLEHFASLGVKVVDQAERRVLGGESVPATEKVVSIFEDHTDIIVKDRRDTYYGHKISLSTGKSSLVLDCQALDGNPADSTLVDEMLDRHIELYDRPPRQAALDGGFASRDNVRLAKHKGVQDICFSKRRGIEVTDMVKSTWVFKQLWRFRAGVEGCISFLKQCFGLGRCTWRGWESFKSYVWSSVVSYNLLVMARHALH